MRLLWTCLRPYRRLATLALALATVSQALAPVDPIIFGWIIYSAMICRSISATA